MSRENHAPLKCSPPNAVTSTLENIALYFVDVFNIYVVNRNKTYEPTTISKRLVAAAVIFALNVFFVWFSIIFAASRGSSFQMTLLKASCFQSFLEVVFYETTECLFLQLIIPLTVAESIQAACMVFRKAAGQARTSERYPNRINADAMQINAAEYLFVSTQAAKDFPELPGNYCNIYTKFA